MPRITPFFVEGGIYYLFCLPNSSIKCGGGGGGIKYLLFSKLMKKMVRTHILSLLFLDGLHNLAQVLFCYENHSNGHFLKWGAFMLMS